MIKKSNINIMRMVAISIVLLFLISGFSVIAYGIPDLNHGFKYNSSNVGDNINLMSYKPILPSSIIYYIPVNITNNQSIPTSVPFQQMIYFDSAAYSKYESNNLQNVEFFYPNGTVIPSWLESGNSNLSSNTTYWLKLSGIPAKSTITIYMGFANKSKNLFNNLTIGEAPQLSPIYGEYDDGSNVFLYYSNFSGTQLGNQWTTNLGENYYKVDNGITIYFSTANMGPGYVVTNKKFGPGTVLDADVTSISDGDNVGFFNITQGIPNNNGVSGTFIRVANDITYPDQWNISAESNPGGDNFGYILNYEGQSGIYSVDILSNNSSIQYINSHIGPAHQPIFGDAPNYPASLGFSGGNNLMQVQWVIARAAPPDNVMPLFSGLELPKLYNITFTESGLKTGKSWTVTLNGFLKLSSSPSISFEEPNGTYSYIVKTTSFSPGTPSVYYASPNSGSLSVNGSNVNQSISVIFYPESVQYQPYTNIPVGRSMSFGINNIGQTGVSFGVMNTTMNVSIYNNNTLAYTHILKGAPTDYSIILGNATYGYFNLNISGSAYISVKNVGNKTGLFAFNSYDVYITNYTASLIGYPPQYAVNIVPNGIPNGNITGLSFTIIAPNLSEPTPIAIWTSGGFFSSNGNYWSVQMGLGYVHSYESTTPSVGLASNFISGFGITDPNLTLVPGQTYNFSMTLVSNTTWEFAINGIPIAGPGSTGYYNTRTATINGGFDLGLESFLGTGTSVNITNTIHIVKMFEFRVNGKWLPADGATFNSGSLGEDWYNNNATGTNGTYLWGIASNIQNNSIEPNSLLFGNQLPNVLTSVVPISGNYQDPLYGMYYVNPENYDNYSSYMTINGKQINIKANGENEIVSLISFSPENDRVIQDDNYILIQGQNLTIQDNFENLLIAVSNMNYKLIFEHIISIPQPTYEVNFTISHSFTNITSKFESITGGYIDNDWTANSYFGDNGFITLGGDGLAFYENDKFMAPSQRLPGYLLSAAWDGDYFMVVGSSFYSQTINHLPENNGPVIGIYYPENNTLISLDNLIPSYLVENTTFNQVVWNGSSFLILGEHSSNASNFYWKTIFYSYSPSTGKLENMSNLIPGGFLTAHMTGLINTPYGTFILLYSSNGDRLGLIENNKILNLTSSIPQNFTFNQGEVDGTPMLYENGMLFIAGNYLNDSIIATIYNAETNKTYNLGYLFSGLSATIDNVAYSNGLFILYGITNEGQEFLYGLNPITYAIYDLTGYIPPNFASNNLFNTIAAQGNTIYITGGSSGNVYYGILTFAVSYKVSFIEHNLPNGTTWYLNLSNGQTFSSTTNNITIYEPNGQYSYTIATSDKTFQPSPSSGSFTVNGSAVSEPVTFSLYTYSVTFTESGLPSGITWYVNLTSGVLNHNVTPGVIIFTLTNGTYSYSATSTDNQYRAEMPATSFTVNGHNMTISVDFTNKIYNVTFTESGLPSGITWYVNLTDGTHSGAITGTSYTFSIANGNYSYSIASSDKIYSPSSSQGAFMVDNSAISKTVTFTEVTYNVSFTESGLPSGTSWSVTLNGTTKSSTTDTITFSVPNGTYSYSIGSVSGYTASNSNGSVTVNGNNIPVSITFSSTSPTAKQPSSGIPSIELYGIIGALVAVAAIGSAVALIRKRR